MIAILAPALLLAGPAAAQTAGPRSGERADIPFATHDGIRTFTAAEDERGVYIEDNGRNWYFASFYTRCTELPFAPRIGFTTWANGSALSRGDTILAGRERCRIADIVRSGPPPKKAKKPKKAAR